MFTGIVHGTCEVVGSTRRNDVIQLSLNGGGIIGNPSVGSSVAVNGCCLTVSRVESDGIVGFDVIHETANITNLGALKAKDVVNVEPSVRIGDELGGHIVSGHVACKVEVATFEKDHLTATIALNVPREWMRYLMPKGFVALNGASLTISKIDRISNQISVNLIPETLTRTTFGIIEVGDWINLEVDAQTQAVVETTLQVLKEQNLGQGD